MFKEKLKDLLPFPLVKVISRARMYFRLQRFYFLYKKEINSMLHFMEKEEKYSFTRQKILDKNNITTLDEWMIPSRRISKQKISDVKVHYSKCYKRYYVLIGNNRMYMKESMSIYSIQIYVHALMAEQEKESPHLYLRPEKESIIADVGAAEGFFTLLHLKEAKYVYLFESDPEWIDALRLTFKPFEGKVDIIERFVGDQNTERMVSLDSFFKEKEIDYLKADIEGSELSMLQGAKCILKNHIKQCSIAVYHNEGDYDMVIKTLRENKFFLMNSPNFMIAWWDFKKKVSPDQIVRRGILYGEKRGSMHAAN